MATEELCEPLRELHAATATENASRLGKVLGEKSSQPMKKYAKKVLTRGVAIGGTPAAPATLNIANVASTVMQAAGAPVPAGSLVAAGTSAGAGALAAGGSEAANFKNRTSRKALAGDLHHLGARGTQTEAVDGPRFGNVSLPARAIIAELTGPWARVTVATNGDAIVADKMPSA